MSSPTLDTSTPITSARALELAREYVGQVAKGRDLVVREDRTVERSFGWVFFYAARLYLETQDYRYLLPGAAPIVIHRADGSRALLPTSIPSRRAIEIYEQRWRDAQTMTSASG